MGVPCDTHSSTHRNDLAVAVLQYVDDTISRLLSWKPELSKLVQALEDKVYLNRRRVRSPIGSACQ